MIIISSKLCEFLAWFTGFSKTAKAVAVFPFIFIRSNEDAIPWVINHERIHIRQQLELLLVGAVALYIIEFLYALIILQLSWYEAYLWNSAEQEAYRNQNNLDYQKNRKIFSQFYYLRHKRKFTHFEGVITYEN